MKVKNVYIGFCIVLFFSCKPTDPSLVHIPASDTSKPTIAWLLDIESDSGNSGSKTLSDAENVVSIKRSDKAHLYLVATDNESGIHSALFTGEFDYLCIDPNAPEKGANSHGSIPGNIIAFDQLKVQALKSWKLDGYRLLSNFTCDGDYTYSRGKFIIDGEAVNMKKDTAHSKITIQVLP